MKSRLIYHLSVFLLVTFCQAAFAQYKPSPVIPDFTFQTMEGRLFTQRDLINNKKIIFIFFDVTCDHCQHEMQDIGRRYADFKNVVFYLVSMDTKPAILKFMSSYGRFLNGKPGVTILHDYKPEFVQKFGPDKFPAIFVYSEKRHLIKYLSGQKDVSEIVKATKKKFLIGVQ
ncbi:peroxiredoxin family protein [Arcticibacter tournemirensis]